ncbi:MAG: hypothetical protein J5I92_14100 [Thiogranum sp.]|nr:hypothetical protein [Thiogranum sp.]
MRKLVPLLVLIVVVFATVPWLFRNTTQPPQLARNLPWQIELLPDGTSSVFGIELGHATLDDVREQLGDDMELAVIVFPGETQGGLEMFYSHYTAGLLSGKLIVAADVAPDTLAQMRERAVHAEYMQSSARKFRLHPQDLPLAWQARVKGLTFVPTVDIGEDAARKRFGEPASRVVATPGATHWLYPDKGLDLILNEPGKDVLQYVAPRDFATLTDPLERAATAAGQP